MAPRRSVAHRSPSPAPVALAVPAVPTAANAVSPRDLLIGFQLRRENRALYDTMEALRAQAMADLEAQSVRQAELERRIELAQQENLQLREAVRSQGEHVEELGEKVQRNETSVLKVVQQLSSGMLSGSTTFAAGNDDDDEASPAIPSSPPLPTPAHRTTLPLSPASAEPQFAPFIPPHQRYPLRRPANTRIAAAVPGPPLAPVVTQSEYTSTRANMSRKKSIPASETPAPETPIYTAGTRARSNSTSSTLSTAPSTPSSPSAEPVIPDLPFNRKGNPHQSDLDIDMYFAAAVKFARVNGVSREPEDEQTTFILKVFKGMKKEERTELVGSLEQVSLAKMDQRRRTVTFLGLWDEIANAVDGGVLAEAKAKAHLLRATGGMVAA